MPDAVRAGYTAIVQASDKLVLCIFVDAFGWELSKKTRFLDDVLIQKVPLETVFGYSSACDPTILTGKLPREHGHFAFYAYDPANTPFRHYEWLDLLPAFVMQRGRVRSKLSAILKQAHGFSGYFQLYNMPFRHLHLFNYMERRNIFEPGGINGGQATILDHLREQGVPFCRPQSYDERKTFDEAHLRISEESIAFAYLFLGRLDGILHAYGTESRHVIEHLSWYEARIRDLYRTATRNYGEVHLYVFSDHGMTDVIQTCDLIGLVGKLGLEFGKDYVTVYDSTMARFWFPRSGARDAIVNALAGVPCGRVLSRDELAKYGCDFPGNTYGELFFLMNPGVLICPSFMGDRPLAGMHGYDPEHKDSKALFMSNIPTDPPPTHLVDLYAVMQNAVSGPLPVN